MKWAVLIVMLIGALETSAQSDSVSTFRGITVYSELGGASLGITLNVDKVLFRLGSWQGSVRGGFGRYNIENNRVKFCSVPIGITFFNRPLGRHHKELGLNISFVRGSAFKVGYFSDPIVSEAFYLTPTIGYRFQKPEGSVFVKVQYSPFILIKELESRLLDLRSPGWVTHFAGVSFGYYFGDRYIKYRMN